MATRARAKRKLIVPFMAPAVLVYLAIVVWPGIQALNLSFFDWSGFGTNARFIGPANFTAIPGDDVFRIALLNNLVLFVVGGIGVFGLAFLALAVFPPRTRGRETFRVLVFLPQVVPLIALSILWTFVYNYDFGLLNALFRAVGLTALGSTTWMGPNLIEWAVVIALIWTYAGFYTILLMAAADRIPGDLLEAALLEGASRFQVFRSITLPLIWNVLVIGIVFWIIDAMNQFDFVFALGSTTGEPRQEIWTLPIYIFEEAFGERIPIFRLGYATAMAVFLVALIVVMIVVVRRLLARPIVEY
jgi:raffinose/stachyose/melibiose transport system permease protein